MKLLIKIDRMIYHIQTYFCMTLFILILAFGTIQIFARYVGQMSVPWTEELMRFLCIWMTLVGSALTIRVDGHVSVDVLISTLRNNKWRAVLFVISRLIAVAFLIAFFPASMALTARASNSLAASMPLPYTYVYLAVPVGIVMMLCAYASTIPRMTKEYMKGER